MAKREMIAGLDMGSGRVACLIGTQEPKTGRLRVLGGANVVCRGLKGGVVVNIEETERAVTHCVEEAEALAKVEVHDLYLGVRGSHLQSFNNHGALNIARTDREITAEDVQGVIGNAKAIPLSSDREILHVVPQGFSLDRQRGVPNPIGMEANLLEVDVHVVTASSAHLNNVTKTIGKAGFRVIEPVYGVLAAGEQLVPPEEKDLGALLVDFGGQSISLAIYSEGGVRYTKELSIGADFITRDLAVGLQTSIGTAERLKLAHGIAHPSLVNGDAEIDFHKIDGRTASRIKTSTMMGIILPRVEEIFSVIAEDIKPYEDMIASGAVILTGGGSLMPGTAEAAKAVLGKEVRTGLPHPEQVDADEKWLAPAYATALGLLTYSANSQWGTGVTRVTPRKKPAWLRKVTSMLEELF